jgi:hypothetical protein
MRTKVCTALLLGFLIPVCCSCESRHLYNRYNLHYIFENGVNKGSYANYTRWPGHGFVPYNTGLHAYPSGDRIWFKPDAGLGVTYEFNPGRMGMSAKQYVDLITSPAPVSYEGLNDADHEGIQTGNAMVGMTKQGVMIALGYPAKHLTASLEQNRWFYWKGRHHKYAVEFDDTGVVVSIMH